jgi:tetratricopeptide (TPR) repeat protein
MTAVLRRLWGPTRAQTPAELFTQADRRRREGRAAEAGRLVAAGLALDPDNLTGHLLAAYLHLAARTIEPARGEFAWILQREPTHPRALLGLARIALEDGDVMGCRDALTRALRRYPDFPEAQALLTAVGAVRPPARAASPPPASPLERLRLPGRARAFVALGADGTVLAVRPAAGAEQAARLAGSAALAAAAMRSARLGPPRRAVLELGDESWFVRVEPTLTLALALPPTTQITPGLLEVNCLWAATGQDARRVS